MKLFDGYVLLMVALVDTLVRDVVVFAGSVGIAQVAGLTGEQISVDTVGVYEFSIADATDVAVGDAIYYDGTDATIVDTDTPCGVAWSAKATGDGQVIVQVKIG